MRLLEILMLQINLNNSRENPEFFRNANILVETFNNDITVKTFKEANRSFITLFGGPDQSYICSLEMLKERIIWNTFKDVLADIELYKTDITEDESYLILEYGKYFGKDILDKIGISMDILEEIVMDSIQKHNQGEK